jgi:THUMP domain-like/RNA cap guanine-N2 methyltransferase
MNDDPAVLLTPLGRELLSRLAAEGAGGPGAGLALAERLRREYPASLVAVAMAQQELRVAAAAKFSRAADMLFTRAGYEQASSEAIATYRAARLGNARRLADLCCGIGGDLIALAASSGVLAVDRDETHARLARHNAAVYGRAEHVTTVVADVRDVSLARIDAVFIDPARRSGAGTASAGGVSRGSVSGGSASGGRASAGRAIAGRVARDGASGRRTSGGTASAAGDSAGTARRFRAGLSEPPLDWCAELTEKVPAVCVKAAPGLPEDLIPPGWEAEFIAEGRDLKEAVLWSPALATAPPPGPRGSSDRPRGSGAGPRGARGSGAGSGQNSAGPRRATVLVAAPAGCAPRPATLTGRAGDLVPLREPGEYLLDPNPAVTRAGLVEDLARELGGAAKIDPEIAFLTLDRPVTTPFARTLRVLESAPWNEKQFAKRLRDLGIGAVDIRRRGLAGDVDQIRRRLKLAGKDRATVVITRVNDRPWGLICIDPA